MQLSRIEVRGFRRISDSIVDLNPVSFLVGANNAGKSSALDAIHVLLHENKLSAEHFHQDEQGDLAKEVELIGHFVDIDPDVAKLPIFNDRIDSKGVFKYRKVFELGKGSPKYYCWGLPRELKNSLKKVKTAEELATILDADVPPDLLDSKGALVKEWKELRPDLAYETTGSEWHWVENPGGFASIIGAHLPRAIRVPVGTGDNHVEHGKSGALTDAVAILFKELIAENETAGKISDLLEQLENEIDPSDETSAWSNLGQRVNDLLQQVFPESSITVDPQISDASSVLRPTYDVQVKSNVSTGVEGQGTGVTKTAMFSLFKVLGDLRREKEGEGRRLVFLFEEPETFLHPAASSLLRDTIYTLGETEQVICTTHSPNMIDASEQRLLSVARFATDGHSTKVSNYALSDELRNISGDDRERLKLVLRFEEGFARALFGSLALVVEGASEVVAIGKYRALLSPADRTSANGRICVINANGKRTIPAIAKYLDALEIPFRVLHDRDGDEGAEQTVNANIETALGAHGARHMITDCLEDALGYESPQRDKPYRCFAHLEQIKTLSDLPDAFLSAMTFAHASTATPLPAE